MAMSFLSQDVLSAPVDLYYFAWAPFNAAFHNFKASVNFGSDSTQQKVAQVAFEKLTFPEKIVSATCHFIAHAGTGIALSLPVLNLLPFGCLMIKAKEFVNPGMNEEITKLKTQLANAQTKVHFRPKSVSTNTPNTTTSSSTKPNNPDPEIKVEVKQKPIFKTTPKPIPVPTPIVTPTETTPLNDRAQRRESGARVTEMMKRYTNNQNNELQAKDVAPHVVDHEAILKEKLLEEEVVANYFNLFPEETPHKEVRKGQDKSTPVAEEKLIVNNLILNYPGFTKDVKFANAQVNLKTLRNFLIEVLGEKDGNTWIRETYSNDVQVKTKDNPCEIVRRGIFSTPADKFLDLIKTYAVVANRGCIEIHTKEVLTNF